MDEIVQIIVWFLFFIFCLFLRYLRKWPSIQASGLFEIFFCLFVLFFFLPLSERWLLDNNLFLFLGEWC